MEEGFFQSRGVKEIVVEEVFNALAEWIYK